MDKPNEHSYTFGVSDYLSNTTRINKKGLMVDCGATTHIVTKDNLKKLRLLTRRNITWN